MNGCKGCGTTAGEWGCSVHSPNLFVRNKDVYPFVCPVCEGRGFVQGGFYSTTIGVWSSGDLSTEPCRSCNGTGVIWR